MSTLTEAPQVHPQSASHTLNVPAIRGFMGTTQYFTVNFPLGMVVRLFTYDPEKMSHLPVEQRTQRQLKKSRVPEIAQYVQQEDYFFSSLTVSVDADWLDFQPSEMDENVGVLRLPMETNWIINDGQHRVAGIAEALDKDPTLRNDVISVIVVADAGLERSQQIFSDLNRTVMKTSKSLDILFDHRSAINRIATSLTEGVRLFKGKVDKERMSLSAQSPSFATLNGIQQATAALLAHVDPNELSDNRAKYQALVTDFWEYVTSLIEPWPQIANGTIKPGEARSQYISSYQMMIAAIGAAGGAVLAKGGDWKKALSPLKDIDWKKSNPEWQGLVMVGPEVVTRVTTRKALADYLRYKVGVGPKPRLPLGTPKQQQIGNARHKNGTKPDSAAKAAEAATGKAKAQAEAKDQPEEAAVPLPTG